MLDLSEDQRMIVRMLSDIAENEIVNDAFEWNGEFPWKNLKLLGEQGFLGINIDQEYGGGGLGEIEAVLAIETIGRYCPDTANALYGQSMVAPRAIDMFGTEEAKERYLPDVCAGKSAIAIAISEPHAGSDAGAMNTQIKEDHGDLYLSGEKIWVSNVPESDAAVVWARFPDGNLGTVVMDFDAPGIEIGEHYENMANHTQTHFFMKDVPIPKENVLVRGKSALKEQLKALNWERCGSAAFANAMSRCALEKAIGYAREREQFDQALKEFQGIRWKIAEMTQEFETARTLTYRAVANAEQQDRVPDRLETSLAKLTASEVVESVVSESLQIHGATGYQKEHPLEYLYRLQRGRRIAAGTDEIMLNNIADQVFKSGLPSMT